MNQVDINNIPKEKFTLVNENKKLRDKELITKPIGFFKDAMYRFSRNKGSIVGAIVIGILVLYAIIAPIVSPYTVSYHDSRYKFTLPKIFTSEKIDFLDGCSKKTLNETSFLYYYSMGQETGHNAIKRQEYKKNEETNMYTFRLDSYQSVGMVYLGSIPENDYLEIQEYQDVTGRQVIYPITDADKRPAQAQDKNDANFWYETTVDGSRTVPANYTIGDDGTVTYTNIYLEYDIPRLSSKKNTSFVPASYVKLKKVDDTNYAIDLTYYVTEKDENKNNVKKEINVGYLCLNRHLDMDYFSFEKATNGLPENVAKFSFNTTYNVPVFNLTGHKDASLDGEYYLSLPAERGSTVNFRSLSLIEDTDYLALSFFDMKDASSITELKENEQYAFGIAKNVVYNFDSFIGGLTKEGLNINQTVSKSSRVNFISTDTDDGSFTINIFNDKIRSPFYANIDDKGAVFSIANTEKPVTVWKFDAENKGIYTSVASFADASKNGNYYLASALPDKTEASTLDKYGFTLAKKEEIEANDYLQYYKVCNSTGEILTEDSLTFGNTGNYRLRAKTDLVDSTYFILDGSFKGDNYKSKMRVEGSDTYKYSYAYAKDNHVYEIRVNYYEYYRYYHSYHLKDGITEPFFLFGTTNTGQDIFTCLASGARFSFALAIIVASVNLFVGAIYGALEGYYGGKVDLVMERIVEILSAVPFMIVITLLKYHMKGSSDVIVLFIAFFLTGWIGMSGTVRMQFYRFKNQEYVLASRTLGARDWRIMFKHIFPNALGTIVTSCVLVIPGMIFSETSLSYLGIIKLNGDNLTSVGTLLADAQPYLVTFPHMIVYPSVFISLLMLCFNLFGNGLRDAFNPSLRGTED